MSVRRALAADADQMAAIHVAAYEETYRSIAPPEIFEGLNLDRRQAQWRSFFAAPHPDAAAYVAESGGEVVGFGSSFVVEAETVGWVKTLYLLRRAQGTGLGRALMATMVADLAARGVTVVRLDVAEGNGRAAGFYQALGGTPTTSQVDPGPIWKSVTWTYEWRDLGALIAAACRG